MFYSIQGEGATMGVPAVFLRLSGCNLMCGGQGTEKDKALYNGAKWRCDTIEVWRQGNTFLSTSLIEVLRNDGYLDKIQKQRAHLVITGGEPVLQAAPLSRFLELIMLECPNVYVELETNGTVWNKCLNDVIDQVNCSPKLANSGMPLEKRVNVEVLKQLSHRELNTYFKFVVSDAQDLIEVNNLVSQIGLSPVRCYLMPAADTKDKLSQLEPVVAEMCKLEGYRFSSRLQVEIWNTCTGV